MEITSKVLEAVDHLNKSGSGQKNGVTKYDTENRCLVLVVPGTLEEAAQRGIQLLENLARGAGDSIKSEMDVLRREWDRLDDMGSQSDRQNAITRQLERMQEKLRELTGEVY
jgi:hypothetical protein